MPVLKYDLKYKIKKLITFEFQNQNDLNLKSK